MLVFDVAVNNIAINFVNTCMYAGTRKNIFHEENMAVDQLEYAQAAIYFIASLWA